MCIAYCKNPNKDSLPTNVPPPNIAPTANYSPNYDSFRNYREMMNVNFSLISETKNASHFQLKCMIY